MIDWLRPLALLLLPLPLLLPLIRSSLLEPTQASVLAPPRIAELFTSLRGVALRQERLSQWRKLLAWLGWIALIGALAVPITRGAPLQQASGRDLLLAIDLSSSMQTRDVSLNGQITDRYSAVKSIAGEFIRGRAGDRIGLIVFAKDPYLLSPLSFDTEAVAGYLHEVVVGLAGQKTALGDAIGLAVNTLRAQPEAARVLILLSDGESNAGRLVPVQAAELARKHSVRVHTIGFSGNNRKATPEGNPSSGLQSVAQLAGGRHFNASGTAALRQVYAELDLLEPSQLDNERQFADRDWQSQLLWLALACLFCLSLIDWREQRL